MRYSQFRNGKAQELTKIDCSNNMGNTKQSKFEL